MIPPKTVSAAVAPVIKGATLEQRNNNVVVSTKPTREGILSRLGEFRSVQMDR
jgi:hypothetical protein